MLRRIRTVTLRKGLRYTSFSLFAIAVAGVFISWAAIRDLDDDVRQVAMGRQERNMAVAWDILRRQGGEFQAVSGVLLAGDRPVSGNNDVVDHIQSLVGGVAALFLGDIQVSTNVLNPDGSRAIGSRLAQGPVHDAVFRDNKRFRGAAEILGQAYFAAYDPILDAQGQVIGALFVGVKQDEFLEPVSKVAWRLIEFLGFMVVSLALVAIFLVQRVIQPVSIIERAMLRLARNDPTASFDPAKVHDAFGNVPAASPGSGATRLFQDYPPDEALGGQSAAPGFDHGRDLGRIFRDFVDTIERREAAALASERRLADIINLLPDATMVIDRSGRVLFWNRAMETMTGIAAADMVGKDDYEYALPFYGKRRPVLIDMVLRPDAFIPDAYPEFEPRGDTIWGETDIVNFRGRPTCLRGSASVLRDDGGQAIGAIETIFDVTDRRQIILDLQEARDTAERASQAKSTFLATMSHELRTPLNSMIGFTEFVSAQSFGPVGDPQYLEHAEYANQSAHHLLDIINGMLDFSKIEAGMMQIEPVRVPVLPIIRRSIRMVQDLAQRAGITIKSAIPPNIPTLWVDERALRQILINLLGNAIKFNVKGGSILVTALEAGKFIDIVVADTGTGIPENAISRICKPFEQIDNHYSRTQGGTGLGLSIVEGLINLHGGALTIASEVGKGTAVTVRLPQARTAASRPGAATLPPPQLPS